MSLQYFFLGAKEDVHSFAQADVFEDTSYLEKATLDEKILVAFNEVSRMAS